jgi:hypothetical protein
MIETNSPGLMSTLTAAQDVGAADAVRIGLLDVAKRDQHPITRF